MRKKLNKAVALFCLTGLIVGGGITNQAKAEDSQNNSLNSAIMGQIPGIPIGSTVSYTFKSSKIASYAACVASEKKPEAETHKIQNVLYGCPAVGLYLQLSAAQITMRRAEVQKHKK